ncbi:NAD(+) synthase [Luteolibacter sp. Populi]|uniref:NAD(+) synthase n=1 Tax=Luteolibacter sp. Populi TaxID=3230487 RepID=UPI003465A61F
MSLSPFKYLRLATCVPSLEVAAVGLNVLQTIASLEEAKRSGAQIALLPELGLTGYTCGDLFFHQRLLDEAVKGLGEISVACAKLGIAALVGLPLAVTGRIYNVAAVIGADGKIAGIVPKTHLPNAREFYERRWFGTAHDLPDGGMVKLLDVEVPFGTDLLFPVEGWDECIVGVEICEDLWSVIPPSCEQALAGANVLLNLSASNELLGKVGYRRDLVRQQAARCIAAYAYCSCGPGESTTDVVYSGHALIAENGRLLGETARFSFDPQIAVADIDVGSLLNERTVNNTYRDSPASKTFRRVPLTIEPWPSKAGLLRHVDPRPFVPSDPLRRAEHCEEIFRIQSTALVKRLRHTKPKGIVLGLSGGLDSTLAALVAVRAFDLAGMDRQGIVAITMPGFGTTDRTYDNSLALAKMLGISLREIPIRDAVDLHFKDIGHPPDLHDITYENSQARERTQILMDVANQIGGFVLGTGDLSELALGWCTFNGDHMSMYHVNAGIPKTLVRHLVEWCANEIFRGPESALLHDIAATPISPELLPPDAKGEIAQHTEDLVGPYSLHDFFLFQFVRNGFPPEKILFLAEHAFSPEVSRETIAKWLEVFLRRFFSQQFKRNAMPDGPKVGSVALSPRGDWRMPSDCSVAAWIP